MVIKACIIQSIPWHSLFRFFFFTFLLSRAVQEQYSDKNEQESDWVK